MSVHRTGSTVSLCEEQHFHNPLGTVHIVIEPFFVLGQSGMLSRTNSLSSEAPMKRRNNLHKFVGP